MSDKEDAKKDPKAAAIESKKDDIKVIMNTHGLVCGLLVGLALTIESGVRPAANDRMDFYGAIAKEQGFRTWVFEKVEQKTPAFNNHNWTIEVSPGYTVDIKHELLHGIGERHPGCDNGGCILNGDMKNLHADDIALSTVVSVLFPEFDMRYMQTWFLHNPKGYRASTFAVQYGAGSAALFFSGLIGNVLLQMSFALSPAGGDTDKDGTALRKWMKFGMPQIYIMYFILMIAIFMMFSSNMYRMFQTSPYPEKTKSVYSPYGFYALVPFLSFALYLLLGGAALRYSGGLRCNKAIAKTKPAKA